VASKPPTYAGQRNRSVARPAFPKERNIAGQLEAFRTLQPNPVSPSPCEHPGILLPAALPGFVHDARHVFAGVHCFAAFPAPTQIKRSCLNACFELGLVVECCDDLVSALVPVRVVLVVPHDVTGNLVVLWIDGRHDARIRRPRCRTSRCALLHQSSRLTTLYCSSKLSEPSCRRVWTSRSCDTGPPPKARVPPDQTAASDAGRIDIEGVDGLACCHEQPVVRSTAEAQVRADLG
jgi:hypothetical protein